MPELEDLIQWWKDELTEGSQHHNPTRQEKIRDTIVYLEKLNEIWKGEYTYKCKG